MVQGSRRRACSRRAFLKRSAATVASVGLFGQWHEGVLTAAGADEAMLDAARLVPGKDRTLLVHNAKTLEIEATLEDPKVLTKPWVVPKQTLTLAPFDQLLQLDCTPSSY